MSQSNAARPANGHAVLGRRTVDWTGYPALFQRVAPAAVPAAPVGRAVEEIPGPAPVIGRSGGLCEAFLGFCQAALFSPGTAPHADRPSESAAALRALAAAEAFGFTREEVRRLGCGLYAGPAAVREDLRGVGFSDAEIDAARIACDDAGRPRAELAGCLVVPLTDERGDLRDALFLTIAESGRGFSCYRYLHGPDSSNVAAFGLPVALSRPAGRESLVLVEEIADALLLQCRGLHHVAAVGGPGADFSPRRWEELARLGVVSVTLAFRRDERHAANVRDALVSALRARKAPEVYVANPYPAGERCAADVLRRLGKDTCAVALAARSLAFHDKDFCTETPAEPRPRFVRPEPTLRYVPAPEPTRQSEPARQPEPAVPAEPHYRTAFRKHVAELAAALPREDRTIAEQVSAAVEAAILAGDFGRGFSVIGDGPAETAAKVDRWFWATGPGGYAVPAPLRANPARTIGEVLDDLARRPAAAEIPAHLAGYAGRDAASSVEWVIDESPRGRLVTLCERIIDAGERRPEQAILVVCGEHTERQITLALATCLAGRLAEGKGLCIEEVRARFAGAEPTDGYRDKPWLADEAADRLRLRSAKLSFVTAPTTAAGRAAVEQALDAARATAPIGGLYFDASPAAGPYSDLSVPAWLHALATRYSTPVVVAAPPTAPGATGDWPAGADRRPASPPSAPACWPLPETEGGRAVLTGLRDWLRRESETARV